MSVQTRSTYQAAMAGALLALVAVVGMFFVMAGGARFQPTDNVISASEFVNIYNNNPDSVIAGFTFDSLFIVAYTAVFAGLAARVWQEAPLFALVGLALGLATALLDTAENMHLIVYGFTARNVGPLLAEDLALPGIYMLTYIKWVCAFMAMGALGLAFPRATPLELVIKVMMLAFVLVGIIGLGIPTLALLRTLFFVAGMALFATLFRGYARQAAA